MFKDLKIGDWFKFSSTDPYSFKKIGVDAYSYPLIMKVQQTNIETKVLKIK